MDYPYDAHQNPPAYVSISERPATSGTYQYTITRDFEKIFCEESARSLLRIHSDNHASVLAVFDHLSQKWKKYYTETGGKLSLEPLWKAVAFASAKHQGQFRKDAARTPYIIHPMGVLDILWEKGQVRDLDTLIAALLHDTLEDTNATAEEIEERFGAHVLAIVQDLTNDPNLSSEENKQRQIDHAPKMCLEAKQVKLADRIYNLSDLMTCPPPEWSEEHIRSYFGWGQKLLDALKGTNSGLESALEEILFSYEQIKLFPAHFVGALGEKWKFPSDHLPVGATIDHFHIATWNVLNSHFIHWIKEGGQGLSGSLITQADQVIKDDGLTLRDLRVVETILQMLQHPTHPKSVIALQECSPALITQLKTVLPKNFQLLISTDGSEKDQDALIYDAVRFDYLPEVSRVVFDGYPSAKGKAIMDIVLMKKDSFKKFRFMNSHVPGDPNLPGRLEFARYVVKHPMDDVQTILLGDMNFDILQMNRALDEAYHEKDKKNPFVSLANYYTIVGIKQEAKVIDHIFVDCQECEVSKNSPDEVVIGLQSIADLLK